MKCKCSKCSELNEPDDSFCYNCGKLLPDGEDIIASLKKIKNENSTLKNTVILLKGEINKLKGENSKLESERDYFERKYIAELETTKKQAIEIEKLKQSVAKKRNWAIFFAMLFIAVLAIFAIYFYNINPKQIVSNIAELEQEIENKNETIARLKTDSTNLQHINANYQNELNRLNTENENLQQKLEEAEDAVNNLLKIRTNPN